MSGNREGCCKRVLGDVILETVTLDAEVRFLMIKVIVSLCLSPRSLRKKLSSSPPYPQHSAQAWHRIDRPSETMWWERMLEADVSEQGGDSQAGLGPFQDRESPTKC